ncbi:hypothetical protein B0J12DRAFT_721489 [Macrophomina phaseolina]|uniref:AMP-dependent synthetase/ligase domain-containing protein n=1 Tax=Macrophomina phaseolina TaxID=35725 RepID=A0ABQ8FXZ8_9PEZI|nr:hypothetical protein B0J12DRAFT_721489 [Macrophomina phaseolina]
MLGWVKRLAVRLANTACARVQVVMIYTPNHLFIPAAYMAIVASGRIFSGGNPACAEPRMVQSSKTVPHHISGLTPDRIFLFAEEEHETIREVCDWRRMIGSNEEAGRYQWERVTEAESKRNIATNAEQTLFMRYAHKERSPERWEGFLPLYYAYGQLYANLVAFKLRATVYIMKQFVYTDFLQIIQEHKINSLQVAPPVMASRYDLSSVEEISCGAAPLCKRFADEVVQRFKVTLKQGYGMAELRCGAISMPGGAAEIEGCTGCVGPSIPNTECVRAGQPGEMYIRGPQVCLVYWRNAKATAEALSHGECEMGWLWIVSRKKILQELIKVNAEKEIQDWMKGKVGRHKQLVGGIVLIMRKVLEQ